LGTCELINKQKLSTIKAIKYNGRLCIEIKNLWSTLHLSFNTAQDCQVDFEVLNKISNKYSLEWIPFSNKEFISSIAKYNNSSTLGPNKLSWRYLKCIIKNDSCLKKYQYYWWVFWVRSLAISFQNIHVHYHSKAQQGVV